MGLARRYLGVVEVGEGFICNGEEVGWGVGVGDAQEVGEDMGGVEVVGHFGGDGMEGMIGDDLRGEDGVRGEWILLR